MSKLREYNIDMSHIKAPFADKIPFIRQLILDSVKEDVIKKIYLFGSYAYGIPDENSDIDLCVIVDNKSKDRKVYLDIALRLYDNGIILSDILVYNENIFYNVANQESIENTIIKKGKVLYGE